MLSGILSCILDVSFWTYFCNFNLHLFLTKFSHMKHLLTFSIGSKNSAEESANNENNT